MLREAMVYVRAWFIWNVHSRWRRLQIEKIARTSQHHAPTSTLPVAAPTRQLSRSTAITKPTTTRRPLATRAAHQMSLVLHDTTTDEVFARFLWDGTQTTITYLDPQILLPESRAVFLEILGHSLQEHGPYSPEGQCLLLLAADFGDRDEFRALLSSEGTSD
jgi:hypothetical protein